MTCEERRDLLLLLATGALDPAEERDMRQHLATGCAACAAALAEAEATVHLMPQALPPLRAPESAWTDIETRVALQTQMQVPPEPIVQYSFSEPVDSGRMGGAGRVGRGGRGRELGRAVPRHPSVKWIWLGWAVAAGLAIAMGWPLFDTYQELEAKDRELALARQRAEASLALEKQVTDLREQVKFLTEERKSVEVEFADKLKTMQDELDSMSRAEQFMVAGGKQAGVKGRLFWDKEQGRWILMATNVQALPEGKMYELWVITADNRKIAAGVAEPDAKGNLVMATKLPMNPGTLAAAAVTDENGLVVTPAGEVQFLASVAKP